MANVSPDYTGAGAEYVVDRLPFREGATWNHYGFFTFVEGL